MRTAYHEALESSRLDVVRLGALAADAIHFAVAALDGRDTALAGRVIAGDDGIDDLRRSIEAACIELIWRQQPVAGELRQVAAMLEIVVDLERVGDYAVDIAKNAIKLADVPLRPATVEIGRIAASRRDALRDDARVHRARFADSRRDVIDRDDEVDKLYKRSIEALQEEMQDDRRTRPRRDAHLFVLAALERVGDRAQNIAWHTKEMIGAA